MTRTCIVGVGESAYTRWGGITDVTEHALACRAILAAVADAGLDVHAVDGLASYAEDRNDAVLIAADLGLRELRFANMVWVLGGGGGCAAVANAARAVEAGDADVVVVYRSLCQGQFSRFGQMGSGGARRGGAGAPSLRDAGGPMDEFMSFALPFGLLNAPIGLAMVMRRHMHLYGTTSEQMGRVAVACRANANRNPRAVMYGREMTLADHQASRLVADPFHLFDCCLETDGAAAVVVTSEERARDLAKPAVQVLGGAQGAPEGYRHGAIFNVNMPDELYASGGMESLAGRLWAQAGVGPADVEVAQIYDHFSGLAILSLEDFGFCPRGEGGAFVESGAIDWPRGSLPINTAGGHLSEAYVHGLNHVVEGVRQLRGESTSQVDGAEVCLVTSGAGVPSSAVVLGAAR